VCTYWMVCLVLSMDARGSEDGESFLMTCRMFCFSSLTSCICWSSTEATSVRPVSFLLADPADLGRSSSSHHPVSRSEW
jgi:hypothetical protein